MNAPSTLYAVEGGDHSLIVSTTTLKALGSSQEEVVASMLSAIARFLKGVLNQSL